MKYHKDPDSLRLPEHNRREIDFTAKILSIQNEDRIDTVRRMQEELDKEFCYNPHFTEEDRHLIMSVVDQVANKVTKSVFFGNETCVVCSEIIPEGRQVCPRCEVGGK